MAITTGQPSAAGSDRHWVAGLRRGFQVDLDVYGDRVRGTVEEIAADTLGVRIPLESRVAALQLPTAYGTAVFSLENGSANVPVSIRTVGDMLRLQIVGPAEYVERRAHPRRTISLPVTVRWRTGLDDAVDSAVTSTVTLSAGGLQVGPAPVVWPTSGTVLEVTLDLPDGPLQLVAEVLAKTANYGLRMRFVQPSEAAMARLRTLCE